jgi:hypothetical protein
MRWGVGSVAKLQLQVVTYKSRVPTDFREGPKNSNPYEAETSYVVRRVPGLGRGHDGGKAGATVLCAESATSTVRRSIESTRRDGFLR